MTGLVPEQRERGGVRVGVPAAIGPSPVTCGRPVGDRAGEQAGGGGRPGAGSRPSRADAGAAGEAGLAVLDQEERAAADGGKRERPRQQRVEHVLLAAGALEVAGEVAERAEPAAQVVEHEQQDAGADGEGEQDVEVVAPRLPGAAGAQERVVEVVQPPEERTRRPAAWRRWSRRGGGTGGRPSRSRAWRGSGRAPPGRRPRAKWSSR